MKELDKVLGGIFGVACGDALGATLEFLNVKEGAGKYGYLKDIIGGGPFHVEPGEITDDTEMTIAVARGILEEPSMPWKTIGNYFLKWYESNPKDIGNTVRLAFEEYMDCKDWSEAAYKVDKLLNGKSGGNGSLMRCIPVGLYYDEIDKVKSIAKIQSGLTHYAKEAALACELYCILVYELLRNTSKMDIVERVIDHYPIYSDVFYIKKEDLKPTGYVVDSLRCALWCFINTSNFEAAVCEAVNLCGDADTIGAITGGLAGAYYGYDAIPFRWKDKILRKQELAELAKNLFEKQTSKPARFNIDEITSIDTFIEDRNYIAKNIKVSFEKKMAFYNVVNGDISLDNEKSKELSEKEIKELKTTLGKLGIQYWNRKYVPDGLNAKGINWSMKVRVGRKSYQSIGEDSFPVNWREFCECFENLVGLPFK